MGFYDFDGAWHDNDSDMDAILAGRSQPGSLGQQPGQWYNPVTGKTEPIPSGGIPTNVAPDPTTGINGTNLQWNNVPAPPGSAPAPPGGGTGGGNGGGTLSNLLTPFDGKYTPPPPVNLGGPAGIEYIPPVPQLSLPNWKAPPAFSYPDFQMPTAADLFEDPSYTLRRDEGQRGIESAAAGRGLVRSGGTLNDILKYNQGFASSEFGNVVDRRFRTYEENRNNAKDIYNTNYQTQVVDPYTFDTAAAKSMYDPLFQEWKVQGQAGQRQNEVNNESSWQQFLQSFKQFVDQRDSTWDKNFQYATA